MRTNLQTVDVSVSTLLTSELAAVEAVADTNPEATAAVDTNLADTAVVDVSDQSRSARSCLADVLELRQTAAKVDVSVVALSRDSCRFASLFFCVSRC